MLRAKPFPVFSPSSYPSHSANPEALLFSPPCRPALEVIPPLNFKLFFPKIQVYYINRPLLIEPEPTGASPVWVFPDGTRSILFCMFLPICFAFPRPYAEYQKNISRFICMNYSSSQALCRAFLFFATLASITPGSSEVQLCFSLRHPTFTAIPPLNLSCFFQKFRYTVIIDLY